MKGSSRFFSSVGVTGGVILLGWNRLGCRSSGTGFGCFFSDAEPRGGVPGRVKWMVLGRKLQEKSHVSH